MATDETPDGEAARGSGDGILGAGEPIAVGPNDPRDDLGEDPTLIDEDAGE